MENKSLQEQSAHHERSKSKDEGTAGDPEPKKPGSKAQGRKRTKTGCLSELCPSLSLPSQMMIQRLIAALKLQHVGSGVSNVEKRGQLALIVASRSASVKVTINGSCSKSLLIPIEGHMCPHLRKHLSPTSPQISVAENHPKSHCRPSVLYQLLPSRPALPLRLIIRHLH